MKEIIENPLFLKYQPFIFPLVSILIGILLLVLVVLPQINESLKQVKTQTEVEGKFGALNQKISYLENTKLSKFREDVVTALAALPNDKDIPGALNQVLYLLNSHDLKVNALGISNSGSSPNSFGIKVETEGQLSDIKNFVNKIKTSPRIMSVTGLELSGMRGENMQSSIGISIFFQPLSETLPDIENPIDPLNEKDIEILSSINANLKSIPNVNTQNITGPRGKENPFE